MDLEYLFTFAVILVILLLAACVILLLLYGKCRTDCKRIEESMLARLNEKTEFFSNMTHELKTPLSVILGAIQLMDIKKNTPLEDDLYNKNMRVIKYNCYRLLRLTNNLLDMSKIEAGYLKLKPVNCNLDLLLEEIVQSVKPYAVQKQLNLRYCRSCEAISTAVDIEKMERIMLNLLSNAIKFTHPGGTVSVSSYMAGDRVFISVRDSGDGIPAECHEEIFNRFKQIESCPSVESKGSGIGLSLVKSFVKLHLGNIRIISEKGQGCEFIIDLPARQVDSEMDNTANDYNALTAEAAKIELSTLHSTVF